MEKTQRVFVLFIAVFFVSAYLFDLRTGLLSTLGALVLATLFKASFGWLARMYGYDTGDSKRKLATFTLLGLTGTVLLGAYASIMAAGALLAGSLISGALAFLILHK